ncbi:TolC family protein [Sphingobacterium sp. MYb382]|uniref:TolC family protein n=1 Tax=Sphingobacterium sp. MYb382 TaxID=2745278 RepID=UPI00309AB899
MKYPLKNVNRFLLISSMLILASGCKIAKDLPLPQPELPHAFGEQLPTDTLGIGALPWRNFFPDKVLQQLIDSALQKNFDMAIALKNIEQADLLVKQSKWNNIPVVDFQVAANSNTPSKNSLNGLTSSQFLGSKHIEDYTAGAMLSWEADIWGRIRNSNKAVLASYLQREEARKTLQTNLIARIAKGYFSLLMLDQQVRVAQRNIALIDSISHTTSVLYEAGQVSNLAVQQAQAQQLLAAGLVPQLEQEISLQENALSILVGQLPGGIQRRTSIHETRFPSDITAGIPSITIRRRPDIKSRELDLTIANAKVGITKAQLYPALRITASAGVNALKASDWFNIPSSLFGIVGVSVLQPLLQHKELTTNYKLATIEREKTVILFRQSVLNAVGEVSEAMTKIEKLKQQHFITAKRVETLQQAIGNATSLYQNGMANYIEVITAQQNKLQSELDLATITCHELLAITDLYRSLGGGAN